MHCDIEVRNPGQLKPEQSLQKPDIYNFDGAFAFGFRPVSTSLHHGIFTGGSSSKFARKVGLRFSKKALTPSF
jgi:hypothetical protein